MKTNETVFRTQTDKAKGLFSLGNIVEAMKIFKTFKIGFTQEEKRTIEIAYESQTGNASFYQSIGIDTDAICSQALQIIKEKYNL